MPPTSISAVLAGVVSIGTIVRVYRIGESGAKAAWHEGFYDGAQQHR